MSSRNRVAKWVLGSLATACACIGASAHAAAIQVFQIGKPDKSFLEFGQDQISVAPRVFQAGSDAPTNVWNAYQPGSFDCQIGSATREQSWLSITPCAPPWNKEAVPYQVRFSLPAAPRGAFTLHLDAIFRYARPAAPRYEIDINGHRGSYRLNPQPAPELWWPTGSGELQFIGYQSIDMLMPADYFREGDNVLTLRCVDGFGLYYDDLGLSNDSAATVAPVVTATVQPTVFYRRHGSSISEVVTIKVQTSQPLGAIQTRAEVGAEVVTVNLKQELFGDAEASIEIPATEQPVAMKLYLGDGAEPVFRGTLQPARRWRVYAMPLEQAGFGFTEAPARTLEWGNRYIDRALELQDKYPNHSYTLDAAANLDSYLTERTEPQRTRLLEYLRNGKFGLNALYAHYFTGTATTEELFQMLRYSLEAGQQYGFPVDSAAQTDMPSSTWALPQVLAASGIKYYVQGSDQIRGSLNPIGHLNFQSPFYWQGPNGAKVLMWSAVGYRNIENLVWSGWNPESMASGLYQASTFGLEHTLPLYLSHFERQDYPFDAVFLYGLHNDDIPMRQDASADVIARWNAEYAYPQIIPATEREFFGYVQEKFGSQIKTLRGDGGAYWEDEVGADARVEALNRAAQTQLASAEKLDSIATWLMPELKLNDRAYRDTWKNVMYADDYVWSDENSLTRPESYRTAYQQEVHRGYAQNAFAQSRDLLRVASDRIAGMVRTDKAGFVVLNAESWPRGGFFDVELGPGETLQDPVGGKDLPCGLLRALKAYNEVRCWAPVIPSIGYRFFPIGKGQPVVPVAAVATSEPIDSRYYTLQIDAATGAVAHLVDKETGQDLVRGPSGYGLNEYLYISGGDATPPGSNRLLDANPTLPVPALTVNRPRLVQSPGIARFPWGVVVTVKLQALNTPAITSTITLNNEQKQVVFDNVVQKDATLAKEGVYFVFPFNVRQPVVEYQGATAWVNPETDMLPGANRQWFATMGGVRIQGSNQAVGWASVDTPLITLDQLNLGLWPASIKINNSTLYSYAMNNYWYTDAPAQQGGSFRFRYILTSAPTMTQADAMRFSLEARSPLSVIPDEPKQWPQILPDKGASFVESSPAGVAVIAMRPVASSSGASYLLRVQNGTGVPIRAGLRFPSNSLIDANLATVQGKVTGGFTWDSHRIELPMAAFDVQTVVVRVGEVKVQ